MSSSPDNFLSSVEIGNGRGQPTGASVENSSLDKQQGGVDTIETAAGEKERMNTTSAAVEDTAAAASASTNTKQLGSSSKSTSLTTSFDEESEWHKITKIIDDFGSDIGKIKTSICTTPNNCKQLPNSLAIHFVQKKKISME